MSERSASDEAFWRQIEGDAKRTVLCEPHRLDDFLAIVEARGCDHITVLPSPLCPAGQVLVLDESSMEAAWRQTIQAAGRSLYR
ncbi:hypothetical protein ACIRJM_22670 [Streptomyces sp. NPDC102405]|uniref:hypothetical protein n=1 Tax=Streptomyces sp. NPDC102405 TaxID=3366170 RepID=UPI0038261AEB